MKSFFTQIIVCVFFFPVFAFGQGIPVYDNAQMINMIQQAAAQAKDYANQIRQLEAQVQQVQSLTNTLQSTVNIDPTSAIQQGVNSIKKGGASAITGSATEAVNSLYGTQVGETTTVTSEQVRQSTLDTARGAALHAGQQQEALASEATRLKELADQSASTTGTLEALQAGNQINAEIAQQLQKMRAEQLAQDQARNAALLQQQREAQDQANIAELFLKGRK
jgi:P-type conjugative transfer protein TrbJ